MTDDVDDDHYHLSWWWGVLLGKTLVGGSGRRRKTVMGMVELKKTQMQKFESVDKPETQLCYFFSSHGVDEDGGAWFGGSSRRQWRLRSAGSVSSKFDFTPGQFRFSRLCFDSVRLRFKY
ncbi:hypothetical protein Hanom_Chr11g01039781 [Helianthus anomalus]